MENQPVFEKSMANSLKSMESVVKTKESMAYLQTGNLPGQFTNRLLIISADVKGKDSMILFKIKETAHNNSGHVLF